MDNSNEAKHVPLLVNQISAYIGSKKATYISIPITTGARYLDWYKKEGQKLAANSFEFKDRHHSNVINLNIEAAKDKVASLRVRLRGAVIDPTQFEWSDWSQNTYKEFWDRVLEKYIDTVVFLDGWQYSNGCCFEYLASLKNGITILNERLRVISFGEGIELIEKARSEYETAGIATPKLLEVLTEAQKYAPSSSKISKAADAQLYKDAILNDLAQVGNIAQFISFGPQGVSQQRFLWINGVEQNRKFETVADAISLLLERSSERRVNVRSFDPEQPKGHPFVYGLTQVDDVIATIQKNASNGLFSIVNETIDISDGGVSGVALGNLIEFTPNDTPKGVDKPGVCQLQRKVGLDILHTVYGFTPKIDYGNETRVEFSIHPIKRGIRNDHTIIWELETVSNYHENENVGWTWPNNFSKLIGDKAFGLIVARSIGLPVPYTTVISRSVAPFSFGYVTGESEVWIRTAPVVRTPGKFSTFRGWRDPYKIMAEEDPGHTLISSILCQHGVMAEYSGSLLTGANNEPLIEGIAGRGDLFMVGQAIANDIPEHVKEKVRAEFNVAYQVIGALEMEWVYDGQKVWTVQLHKSASVESYGNTIVAGTPSKYLEFDVNNGLEQLRALITSVKDTNVGIKLLGNVGITSHFGDVLRKAKIPSFIERTI